MGSPARRFPVGMFSGRRDRGPATCRSALELQLPSDRRAHSRPKRYQGKLKNQEALSISIGGLHMDQSIPVSNGFFDELRVGLAVPGRCHANHPFIRSLAEGSAPVDQLKRWIIEMY